LRTAVSDRAYAVRKGDVSWADSPGAVARIEPMKAVTGDLPVGDIDAWAAKVKFDGMLQ
jgi:hypothetical protein